MTQREEPGITPEQLAAMTGQDTAGIIVSGGPIHAFRKGWAKAIYNNSDRAHYFNRKDMTTARSYCGMVVEVRGLYGMGNWPKCGNCRRMVKRKGER